MRGNGREYEYPVIVEGGKSITNCKKKAEVMTEALVKIHSSGNLSTEEERARENTMDKYRTELQENDGEGGVLNALFTLQELNGALGKVGKSTPGKERICYSMLENFSDKTVLAVFFDIEKVYDLMWREGLLVKFFDWEYEVECFNELGIFFQKGKLKLE